MTLPSNIPSNVRRPFTAITFDATSGQRGVQPVDRRLLLIGMMTSSGTATADVPVQVGGEADARTLFGEGSEAALMVEWAIKVSREVRKQHGGGQPEIWVAPLAEPAGANAIHRFGFAGTASTTGDIIVKIAGREIRASVNSGDTATTAAAALAAAITAVDQNLPVTAAAATTNCDCTYRTDGVNGGDVILETVDDLGYTITITQDQTPGTGTPALTTALANALSRDYQCVAIANHAAADVTALATHLTTARDALQKSLRQTFVGENGTLGTATTLANPNDSAQCFISIEDGPNLPCELAAGLAAMVLTVEKPSFNFSRTRLPFFPPPDASAYTATEVETALAGGVTPCTVDNQGNVIMQRWVTSKISENGAAFYALLDGSNQRTLDFYALQIDRVLSQAMIGKNVDAEFLNLATDLILQILQQGEAAGDLHNVDEHLDEIRAEAVEGNPSRVLYGVPQSVTQPNLQADVTHYYFAEAPAG